MAPTEHKGKKKNISFIGQVFGALWIGGWSAYKFITSPTTIAVDDILFSGIGIVGVFMPTVFSLWLDKIATIRIGKE